MLPSGPALTAQQCTKRYAGGAGISRVDLEVGPGELVALLGPNGSGKSTLVHGIVGLHPLDQGEVRILGKQHQTAQAKSQLGFVPDELPIPLSLTGAEYLAHLRTLRRARHSLLDEALIDALELEPHLSKFIADMSHGTKKKLQVVGAAAHSPALLVMDEPFRGLDPHAVRTIRALVDALRAEGTAVLVATHDILAAQHWFERVVILNDGITVADGAPSQLVHDSGLSDLEEFFLTTTGLLSAARDTQRFQNLIRIERQIRS